MRKLEKAMEMRLLCVAPACGRRTMPEAHRNARLFVKHESSCAHAVTHTIPTNPNLPQTLLIHSEYIPTENLIQLSFRESPSM